MTTKNQLTIADTVKKMEPEFALALPQHIPSERFTRIAVTAINSNPEIASGNIDVRSVQASIMAACQDGLVIDGREAALVTFNTKDGKKAQYIPMVAGLMKKMRNTGEISTVSTGVVYQKEFDAGRFEYIKGDSESLRHEPILFGERGDMIGVYAVVTLKDGQKIREFMNMDQINKVRQSSKAKDSQYGPWVKWFEEMATKSVLRKISKLCPMASDLDKVFRRDEEDSDERTIEEVQGEVEKPAPKKKQTAAAKVVKAKVEEPEILEAEIVEEDEVEETEIYDDDLPA